METRVGDRPVIVIGGGLAGLAAAVRLTGAGLPVVVLEQRPRTGGRASSVTDRVTGTVVDNGQHLLIAGYDRTLALTATIGSRHLLHVQDRPALLFHHPERGFVRFTLKRLPPPLHLLHGILTSSLFTPAERLTVLRAGMDLRRARRTDETIAGWLDRMGQPASVRASFWGPLAVSIMNAPVETASAATFLDALRIAFLGHWHDAALVFPRADLQSIFGDPAERFVTAHGGTVRCQTGAAAILTEGGRVTAVRLRDGTDLACSGVVLAVPPDAAAALYPAGSPVPDGLLRMAEAPGAPIVSLHLWFREHLMDHEAVGLIGRSIHWVFRRESHYALVISAAYGLVDRSREELVALALEDLRSVFGPGVGEPTHAMVIREKEATVALDPAVAGSRPGCRTPLKNLVLAGDWTATGLPATIEGAIRSGEAAARLLGGN